MAEGRLAFLVLIVGICLAVGGGIYLWNHIPRIGPTGVATPASAITFWHDDARRVGCWVYASAYKGGISCLPDGQYGGPR